MAFGEIVTGFQHARLRIFARNLADEFALLHEDTQWVFDEGHLMGATRAAGAANGANPIVIILPCHRVIGANGSLVGYGDGLNRKADAARVRAGEGVGVTVRVCQTMRPGLAARRGAFPQFDEPYGSCPSMRLRCPPLISSQNTQILRRCRQEIYTSNSDRGKGR